MKRLLIVDDEHHIVNWLVELFESQSNLELVIFKTYTGIGALKILESTKIDIILLDIKMPGMDGLQVSEKILEDWPGCRIIFLTGYNQFEYIYYANKHKNITYLLKTESDEEIVNAVAAAIESIKKENRQLDLSIQAAAKEKLVNHLLRRDFLSDIFRGKSIEETANRMNSSGCDFPLQLNEPVFFLYGKLYIPHVGSYYDNMSDSLIRSMQVIEKILYDKFRYVLYDYDDTTVIWFLQPVQDFRNQSALSPVPYIKESFDDIIAFYTENSPLEILLLLYPQAIEWDNIYNTFLLLNQYALQAPPLQNSQSYGMIYKEPPEPQNLIQVDNDNLVNKCDTILSQMTLYFSRGEYRHFSHLLKQITFASKNINSMHYLPMIGIYQRFSSLLINYINKYNLGESIATQIGLYPLYFIHDFKSWREAFGYLDKLTTIIFNSGDAIQLDSNQSLVITIKDYIRDHLSDNLTLTVLSDVVNYNSSYVSRVFKQTTGMNLSDYITVCRINKAKELLVSSSDSVRIIAEKVGFDTSQYFSMVFRKETGLTPGEFRNKQ